MRAVHKVGLRFIGDDDVASADKIEHRVNHLRRIPISGRDGGFFAFIPWTFREKTRRSAAKIKTEPTGNRLPEMLAVSVLFSRQHRKLPIVMVDAGLRLDKWRCAWRQRYGLDHDRRERGCQPREHTTAQTNRTLRYLISEAGFIPHKGHSYRHLLIVTHGRTIGRDETGPGKLVAS